MDFITNTLQLIGGIILVLGYIPQICKIVRTKSVEDLSGAYMISMFIGISLMEVYAVYNATNGSALMFLVTNSLSLAASAIMSLLYIVYRKGK